MANQSNDTCSVKSVFLCRLWQNKTLNPHILHHKGWLTGRTSTYYINISSNLNQNFVICTFMWYIYWLLLWSSFCKKKVLWHNLNIENYIEYYRQYHIKFVTGELKILECHGKVIRSQWKNPYDHYDLITIMIPSTHVCCVEWRIYLDYNATTPLEPAVIQAVSEALREAWGNPSSSYIAGDPRYTKKCDSGLKYAAVRRFHREHNKVY